MQSVDASFGRDPWSAVLNSDDRIFSGKPDGFQMTASSRLNWNTDLSKIDETRGNITAEEDKLSVKERNFDLKTLTHHRCDSTFTLM